MNVNELLDTIEDALEESANVPLSGGKRIVDVEQIRDCLLYTSLGNAVVQHGGVVQRLHQTVRFIVKGLGGEVLSTELADGKSLGIPQNQNPADKGKSSRS